VNDPKIGSPGMQRGGGCKVKEGTIYGGTKVSHYGELRIVVGGGNAK